jgi:hypothetical protein
VAFVTERLRRIESFALPAACVLLAGARLLLAARAPVLYEIRDVWEPMSRQPGPPPYADPFPYYHFFPPFYWMLRGFRALSLETAIPFATIQRGVLALVDVATAGAVAALARRLPGAISPWRAAALYLASPIAIYVSSVQGQFDGLALLFLVLALVAAKRAEATGSGAVAAGISLGASIAAKQVTALHPILWIGRRRSAAVLALAVAVPAVSLLPYASEGRHILRSLLMYGSVPASYGFSELVLMDRRFAVPVALLALAASVAAAVWLRKSELARGALTLFLVILLFAPGMGTQYLLWPVALGSLFAGGRFLLYSAAATLWIWGGFFSVPGSGRWMGQLTWLAVIFWTIGRLREEIASRGTGEAAA